MVTAMLGTFAFVSILSISANGVASPATPAPVQADIIPPVVLQGCAPKVRPGHFGFFANGGTASASGVGARTVGFDVSFVNTTDHVANLVLLRIGDTTFAKTGTFSPGIVIAWRLAAQPGPCSIVAVRFADGTEWVAPTPPP